MKLEKEWQANQSNPFYRDKLDWVRGVLWGIRRCIQVVQLLNR